MLSNGQVEIVVTSGSGSPVSVRCPECQRLLFKAELPLSIVTIVITTVCPRCRCQVRWPDVKQAEVREEAPNGTAG